MAVEEKVDPIRDNYYLPLERADRASDTLFYLSAVLGVCALAFTKYQNEAAAAAVNALFVVVALASFTLSLAVRLYWAPRAEDCRRNDLAANAFGAPLQPEQTQRYYNNSEDPSFRRLAGLLTENSFFSMSIARKMCPKERIKMATSIVLLLLLLSFRSVGIDWVVIAAQFVASEQVISKWVRLEWLRSVFERTYIDAFALLTMASHDASVFRAKTIALTLNYEAAKANAAVLLSSEVFNKMNPLLTQEWESIHKPKLGLA